MDTNRKNRNQAHWLISKCYLSMQEVINFGQLSWQLPGDAVHFLQLALLILAQAAYITASAYTTVTD